MKQLVLKIGLLAAIVLSLAGCGSTKTGLYPLFCYVEYEGEEETTYSVTFPSEINFKKAEYVTETSSDKCLYFYATIETFTSGNRDILDKVEYSLSRVKGTARCTLYVANYTKGEDNPLAVHPDKDFEMTDEVKAWLHENYIAKCVLEPGMQKASVNVLL